MITEPEIFTTEVFVLTAEPRSGSDSSSIVLYGASPLGPVEISSDFSPYFFVDAETAIPSAAAQYLPIDSLATKSANFTALSGRPVKKFTFPSLAAAANARRYLHDSGVPLYESDVRPRERFLMDRGINGGIIVEGSGQKIRGILRFRNPRLTPARVQVPLRICSFDIETSIQSRAVLSIGVHISGGAAEERFVLMQGEPAAEAPDWLKFVPDEAALLREFLKLFLQADPDLVIGWNVIGFDLSYLIDRAEVLGVNLPLGRDRRRFTVNERSGRFSRADIPGRVVLDGPQLLRSSFYSFESYSLENVSRSVLGEGKLIGPGGNKAWEIEHLYNTDKIALAEYNLKDCILVTEIFQKLGLLDLTIRRTELSGMLLDQVGMSTASFDHFYLPRLHQAGYAAPDVGEVGTVVSAAGGYVMEPGAGIYQDVIGLDFQSLYPTIIRTFKIDPLSRACAAADPVRTPTGLEFSRIRSILPDFIGKLMQERSQAKADGNKALSQAIKILMNSFYGVMGSSGSRLYHPALPDAITATGQWLLVESKRWLESLGEHVIYGDTDSLFVQMKNLKPIGAVQLSTTDHCAAGSALAAKLTNYWSERIKTEFGLDSFLVAEFEKYYQRFLVPAARGSDGGAKKRYAGLVAGENGEEVEFVGLEVVRSDWTSLARDFQRELFTKIFHDEVIDEWIRRYVADVRRGAYDEKLVYRKRLHKPPGEYGKSPPPYARAAMLLPKKVREVRYVMTTEGPVPIELNPKNPDYPHYIDKQLRPVADSILEVLGTSFEEIVSPQMKLL